MSLTATTTRQGDTLVVRLAGELDHHTAEQVRQSVDSEIEAGNLRYLLVDMSGLDFMDSSGIGVLLGRYKRMGQAGGEMAVCGVSPSLARILEMSGVFKIIRAYEDERAFAREMEGR